MSVETALRDALAARRPAVLVRVAQALGSTPREAGALMLVTEEALTGTVGGGALEMEAVIEARRMLRDGTVRSRLDVPLGPAIGQCCGGRVVLDLERCTARTVPALEAVHKAERAAFPSILVFGAGHTGQALARALLPLPFRLLVVDGRADRLAELPPSVDRRLAVLPEREISVAPQRSGFVVMTHDHALDFILAAAALERGDAAYVGMIGSRAKRAAFARHLREVGSKADPASLVLPIGGAAVRDKRPEVIAALVAAELLRVFADEPCRAARADVAANREDPS